jgi:dTDP-4-dehydrorhamnose 3,5-epimerase-like enzyme
MLATVGDLEPVSFRLFRDERGVLVSLEMSQSIPFQVVRFFWVCDVPAGTIRGSHGHKTCHQYMVCGAGSLRVDLDDGHAQRSIALAAGDALHVPPGIFASEHFDAPGSILMVFCSSEYEPDDYITDRNSLVIYREGIVRSGQADRVKRKDP